MPLIAERMDRISPSQTIAISSKARALKAAGRDVISLSAGEPDFDTPDNIKAAAIRAIEAGDTKYTDVAGTKALRQAVADKFKRDSGLDYTADEIVVSTGGKQVIFNAMVATMNAGDEAIIPTPCWVSYPDIVTLADGVPVFVPCGQNNGFKLRAEDLEAAITPRTKWLILNSPNNPTGAAYARDELRAIADVLLRHPGVHVLTDDIYEKLVYGDFAFTTLVQVEPRLRDRTITMNGCSKAYAMTGWRIGFAGGPAKLIKAMGQAAVAEHVQHQQHQPGRGARGAERAAGLHPRDGRRIQVPPRPGRRHAQRGARHQLPHAGGGVLRLSQRARLHRQDQPRRGRHRRRRGLRARPAGRRGCGRRPRLRLHVSGPPPHQLRDRHREPRGRLRADPAVLRRAALTMPALAARLGRTPVAATVAMTVRARALRAAGHDVIALTIGEPDFDSPPHAIEAGYRAALAGDTKYPPQDGTAALKAAIQRKFARDAGLDYGLDEIMVGNGGKGVLFDALMATVDPGDEVIIPAPYWGAYPLMTRVVGGEPVIVACPQNNGFKLRPEDLDAAITPRTKWLLLNLPNNPTGAVATADELRALADVLARHPHVWVLSDDMYEHLVFDGARHATMAAVAPALRDRTLTLTGVSKTYAMTGWRIGFAAGPAPLIRAMTTMQGHVAAGVSTVGQAAAAAALDGPQDAVPVMADAYRRRRDLVVDALAAAPGLLCHRPGGAFYVFPSIAGCIGRTTPAGRRIETDADFAGALLDEAHVAVVAGSAFGMSPYVRISFATDDASLAEACRRIVAWCRSLT